MQQLKRLFFGLVYLLPAVLFFSYYPLISLGSNSTMNFELSLPLIFLVIFDLVAFIALCFLAKATKGQDLAGLSDKRFFLFAILPLYATIAIFWSTNPLRAILTTGVLWLTFFAAFALLYLLPLFHPTARFRQRFLSAFFISTAAVCIFCWVQCFLDVAGCPRDTTLLCAGCTYHTFGFPHPSGFAIEPQFMGNLLLAPTLTALWLLAFTDARRSQGTINRKSANLTSSTSTFNYSPRHRRLLCAAAVFFSATLFLTLSRGAIYAYAVALVVLLIFALVRRAQWWKIIIIPVVTFLIALLAQGTLSALSPTVDTFGSGIAKVVHQLSLGIVDLRPVLGNFTDATTEGTNDSTTETVDAITSEVANVTSADGNIAIFDGYIAESTNVRLGLSELAFDTWLSNPRYFWLGTGLGGAGLALAAAFPDEPLALPNAIVQNEALSLLLELGLIGALLVIFSLLLAFVPDVFPRRFLDGRAAKIAKLQSLGPFWSHPALPLLFSLIIAYLITLNFFSGLPNALHIYLLPPVLYVVFAEPKRHER